MILWGASLIFLAYSTVFAAAGADSANSVSKKSAVSQSPSDSSQKTKEMALKIVSNMLDKQGENGMDINTMIVAVSPFLFALLIIIIFQIFRYKKKKDMNALYVKYLESGKEIPAELLNPQRRSSDLKKGIVLITVGIGICIFLFAEEGESAWTMGLIPLLLGVGFLIVHKLNSKAGN